MSEPQSGHAPFWGFLLLKNTDSFRGWGLINIWEVMALLKVSPAVRQGAVGKLRTRRVELAGGFHTYVMGAFPYDPFL